MHLISLGELDPSRIRWLITSALGLPRLEALPSAGIDPDSRLILFGGGVSVSAIKFVGLEMVESVRSSLKSFLSYVLNILIILNKSGNR